MRLMAEQLSVMLDGRRVLDGINLDFAPGAITALVGPNGAGKSTLLGSLAGLRRLAHGQVLLDDRPVTRMPPAERARYLALLPQGAEIHWDIDVRTLVGLGRLPWRGGWRASDGAEAAVARALARTDAAHLATRRVRSLSGGERARVLLARALAVGAAWLLADEPLAGLDPLHQLEALEALRSEARGGAGVILVLHDLTLAARVADRVIVLHEGRVAANAAPSDAFTPELLARVYGIEALTERVSDGLPVIVPVRRAANGHG